MPLHAFGSLSMCSVVDIVELHLIVVEYFNIYNFYIYNVDEGSWL